MFAEKVRDVVLPGYTAYSARDAQTAAMRMLPCGPIRLKNSLSCGGRGQSVATFMHDPALQVVEASAVKAFGRGHESPRNAVVHFRGDDPQDGPILRYTVVIRTVP